MSSAEDFQVQNVYRYSRKTYKRNRRCPEDCTGEYSREDNIEAMEQSPHSDGFVEPSACCSCDLENETDIASILHKKCPVISLAQQQLQRLLDGTDRLLCDNTRCCRSLYDFFLLSKEMILSSNKCQCALFILIAIAFFTGLVLGAASCGTYLGRFNSPILSCIDSYFTPDAFPTAKESYRSIT